MIRTMTTQEHLDRIDAVIDARLTGTAVERYREATEEMASTPLDALYRIRKMLIDQLAAEGGGGGTSFSYGVMDRGGRG